MTKRKRAALGYRTVKDLAGKVIGFDFDDLAPAVDFMTSAFLEGLAYREIARRLDSAGYAPPRGERWQAVTIRKVLLSDVYAGGPDLPARWDPGTWEAVKAERERRLDAPYLHPRGGPFAGVAFCARCRQPMTRSKTGQVWYMRCPTHAQRRRACHPNYCPEVDIAQALGEVIQDKEVSKREVINLAVAQAPPGQRRRRRQMLARERLPGFIADFARIVDPAEVARAFREAGIAIYCEAGRVAKIVIGAPG